MRNDKWISINDMLPEEGESVLVLVLNSVSWVQPPRLLPLTSYYHEGDFTAIRSDRETVLEDVLFWQPVINVPAGYVLD